MLDAYDASAPLERASTIPASWYTAPEMILLEREAVFAANWQIAGRAEQIADPGQYITTEIGGEPVVVVRGTDCVLRAFFNVCRHHAAAVMTEPVGRVEQLRCPYHGWTYGLDGALRGAPQFAGVCDFELADHGLVPLAVAEWERWVFVRVEAEGPSLGDWLERALVEPIATLGLANLRWCERRSYFLDCNWKVYLDNYLDGGYHVPHLHTGLDGVLEPGRYTIENGERYCLQSSPLRHADAGDPTGAVRQGERALYYWIYPNFMLNWYEGIMDTNLVVPHGPERTEVIFDYWFADNGADGEAARRASIAVSERIQDEDAAICRSVQRGLHSRAYTAGRLSVRREAGEHLFHRLLHADLTAGLGRRRFRPEGDAPCA